MSELLPSLEDVITLLSGKSFDAAVNNPDDYMKVLQKAEAEALAQLNRIIEYVIGEADHSKNPHNDEKWYSTRNNLRHEQRQRLQQISNGE